MNNRIINFSLIVLLSVGFLACNNDDVDVSTITNVPFTIESVDPGITVEEESQVITVNFKLSADQIVDTKVSVRVDPLNSTATNGQDFNFTPVDVEIPAYVRDGSFTFEILPDLDAEGPETVTFIISGVHEPFGAQNEQTYAVTINDKIYDDLQMTFDWEGTFLYQGGTYTLCPNVDLDIYVLDAAGNDLGIYGAATGACPEVLVFDGMADGEYFLASNMYYNGLDSLFLDVDYPMTVTAVKGGVFKQTFETKEFWNSEEEDYNHDGAFILKPVATVTVSGTTYTIEDPDGNVIVSGVNGPKQPHPNK